MTRGKLVPVPGCWVQRRGGKEPGRIKTHRELDHVTQIQVEWLKSRKLEWLEPEELESGFQLGMDVQDQPRSVRRSFGEGVVLETRRIGYRDQVLVEFPEKGTRTWIPFENLKQIKSPFHRFALGQHGKDGHAERFRLKCLAHAIEMWNENTGSLSRLDIDPLPHQIYTVHHILASGNLNWLIADDVGLGKTIEVGMLLAALKQRGFRRILIVTPAGLVKQWQDELRYKFSLADFQIYGRDFQIHDPSHWKMYDHVIGSIDRFKSDDHRFLLQKSGYWDLIIFDEAHRLSRRQYGLKLDSTERFRLAALLRRQTDSIILLSGTPHQGMHDKFQSLLEILRPALKEKIRTLSVNREILSDMIIRNNKSKVTDTNGNLIFKGKRTYIIETPVSEDALDFDRELREYLKRGYAAGKILGHSGIAIGFVMTTYRKLAASSVEAIRQALIRRKSRLTDARQEQLAKTLEVDDRFFGEWEEFYESIEKEFFAGEMELLDKLIEKAGQLRKADLKLRAFLNELVEHVLKSNPQEKVVIFTEYRATQDYLKDALETRFGQGAVSLINGSMTLDERAQAIADFEESVRFLISTEAGGEGINLHRRCHILVNFDLPWNPMRLAQRVGRLYRYGQRQPVIVFNVESPQTLDCEIINLMYRRIEQVVKDLSVLGDEFHEGFADEILGQLAELLDVEGILDKATTTGIQRTREEIEEAISWARTALERQQELFEYVTGFDPEEAKNELKISGDHVRSFLEGIFKETGIEILGTTHQGSVWEIRIPESIRDAIGESRRRFRVTLDRDLASRRANINVLDIDFPLFRYLLDYAKSYHFDGLTSSLHNLEGRALFTALLRWQNEQGIRMRQEFTAAVIHEDGDVEVNPESFCNWLLQPSADGSSVGSFQEAMRFRDLFQAALDRRLSEVSNLDLHPENRQILSAAWINQLNDRSSLPH